MTQDREGKLDNRRIELGITELLREDTPKGGSRLESQDSTSETPPFRDASDPVPQRAPGLWERLVSLESQGNWSEIVSLTGDGSKSKRAEDLIEEERILWWVYGETMRAGIPIPFIAPTAIEALQKITPRSQQISRRVATHVARRLREEKEDALYHQLAETIRTALPDVALESSGGMKASFAGEASLPGDRVAVSSRFDGVADRPRVGGSRSSWRRYVVALFGAVLVVGGGGVFLAGDTEGRDRLIEGMAGLALPFESLWGVRSNREGELAPIRASMARRNDGALNEGARGAEELSENLERIDRVSVLDLVLYDLERTVGAQGEPPQETTVARTAVKQEAPRRVSAVAQRSGLPETVVTSGPVEPPGLRQEIASTHVAPLPRLPGSSTTQGGVTPRDDEPSVMDSEPLTSQARKRERGGAWSDSSTGPQEFRYVLVPTEVYERPHVLASIVATLRQGMRVEVINENRGWVTVRSRDGAIGYIKAQDLE